MFQADMMEVLPGPVSQIEEIPDQLESISTSRLFTGVHNGITERIERESWSGSKRLEHADVVYGFEDVVGEPIGTGLFYNTETSIYQLAFVLSVASNPTVAEAVKEGKSSSPRDIVKRFREKQVLAGLKLLDLGCGAKPGFALAAKSLGAETHTADAQDLQTGYKAKLDSHTVVDLNRKDSSKILLQATGGNFDIVTENIIGTVPGNNMDLNTPEADTIRNLGKTLLKRGGYLFGLTGFREDMILQKTS